MAAPIVNVDPTIYGGRPLTNDAVPEFTPKDAVAGTGEPYSPPERVSQDTIGEGGMSAAIGTAAVDYNSRDLASVGDSLKATVKTWATTRVLDYVNMPKFDTQPDFDVKPYINSVPFSMTPDEQKFMAKSQSEDEFNYRLQQTKDQHAMYQQMGDHPVLSTMLSIADPVYLGIDLASFGVGAAFQAAGAGVRAAKVAAGISAFAGNMGVGKIQQTQAAVSDAEIIGNALFNGAASGLLYKAGKGLVKADETFPSDELAQAANRLKGESSGVEKRIVSEQQDAAGTRPVTVEPPVVPDVVADEATKLKAFAKRLQEENEAKAAAKVTPDTEVKVVPDDGSIPTRKVVDGGVEAAHLDKRGVTQAERDAPTDAYSHLGQYENDAQYGAMIRTLRQEQPDLLADLKVVQAKSLDAKDQAFYLHGNHTVYLSASGGKSPAYTALHEAVHGLTAAKIEYGIANPGSAHGTLVKQLDALRLQAYRAIRADAELKGNEQYLQKYYTKNLHEFAAGLFSGEGRMGGGFARRLANMPVEGGKNMLSKITDTVRKLLGLPPGQMSALTKALGLTDELVNTKLKLNVHDGLPGGRMAAEPSVTFNLAPTPQQIGAKMDAASTKLGRGLEWSLSRSMGKFNDVTRRITDKLVDDPINMTHDSAVSQKQAIRSDLAAKQYAYEDLLKDEMAKNGAGLRNRVMDAKGASKVQQDIERKVYDELVRRDSAVRRGADPHDPSVDPVISKMADAHGDATKAGLKEMQAAGVEGSENIKENAGYATRKWSVTQLDDVENKLMAGGLTQKAARAQIRDLVVQGMQRANPEWAADTARDVATAILQRTRAKGYFEDTGFLGHIGTANAEQVRSILSESGISAERVQRAIDVIVGKVNEGGKTSVLKRRIDIDMGASSQMTDGVTRSVTDLVDTNVTRNLDNYLDNAAGQAALARKGMPSASAIDAVRKEFLHSIASLPDREKAAKLFDNTIASIKGNPVGEEVSDGMRKLAAVTQMIGLSGSGLWQMTEYASAMAKYGMVKTTKEILRTMPGFKQLMGEAAHDSGTASSLHNILTRNSAQDLRIRPYIQKMEDNFEMAVGDNAGLSLQQAKQIVPYLNAMHYIHHNQANVVGNLVADIFHKAVGGDIKAAEAVAKYGLEGHTLGSIKADILKHGSDTSLWSDATWAQVRGPLAKMMDEAVLRNRTGEIPAFAQFSSVGKFIFTFRSFVLGAHNKVLAGSLGREGFAGMGLLMAYQFPLTMMATAAQTTLSGKPETDPGKLAALAAGQMGALGLITELWGAVSGTKQQFGGSGLMAIDRLYKTATAVGAGKYGTATANAINSIPLLSILPGVKAMATTLKDPNTKKPKEQ